MATSTSSERELTAQFKPAGAAALAAITTEPQLLNFGRENGLSVLRATHDGNEPIMLSGIAAVVINLILIIFSTDGTVNFVKYVNTATLRAELAALVGRFLHGVSAGAVNDFLKAGHPAYVDKRGNAAAVSAADKELLGKAFGDFSTEVETFFMKLYKASCGYRKAAALIANLNSAVGTILMVQKAREDLSSSDMMVVGAAVLKTIGGVGGVTGKGTPMAPYFPDPNARIAYEEARHHCGGGLPQGKSKDKKSPLGDNDSGPNGAPSM